MLCVCVYAWRLCDHIICHWSLIVLWCVMLDVVCVVGGVFLTCMWYVLVWHVVCCWWSCMIDSIYHMFGFCCAWVGLWYVVPILCQIWSVVLFNPIYIAQCIYIYVGGGENSMSVTTLCTAFLYIYIYILINSVYVCIDNIYIYMKP